MTREDHPWGNLQPRPAAYTEPTMRVSLADINPGGPDLTYESDEHESIVSDSDSEVNIKPASNSVAGIKESCEPYNSLNPASERSVGISNKTYPAKVSQIVKCVSQL